MEIKYKLYPYPVLSSYSNDYGTGAFDVAIELPPVLLYDRFMGSLHTNPFRRRFVLTLF